MLQTAQREDPELTEEPPEQVLYEEPSSGSGYLRPKDHWETTATHLIRHHVEPRTLMFTPYLTDDPLPVPIQQIDVIRTTHTNIDDPEECYIKDVWDTTHLDHRPLSGEWTGKTCFRLIEADDPSLPQATTAWMVGPLDIRRVLDVLLMPCRRSGRL